MEKHLLEKVSLYGDLIHGKLFLGLQGERGEKQIRS